jgi:hypothetical protein
MTKTEVIELIKFKEYQQLMDDGFKKSLGS